MATVGVFPARERRSPFEGLAQNATVAGPVQPRSSRSSTTAQPLLSADSMAPSGGARQSVNLGGAGGGERRRGAHRERGRRGGSPQARLSASVTTSSGSLTPHDLCENLEQLLGVLRAAGQTREAGGCAMNTSASGPTRSDRLTGLGLQDGLAVGTSARRGARRHFASAASAPRSRGAG